ncbi:disease resistance RPP13-like protein 4 isoform X5 [Magnolia sinica]|uniref:disease resistance RPP13-like protein 4 isoform X5 n=1 Tax=Magnolia sinica TaxID=86752 RepID=UPI00265B1954|nr:disease resistance RPP13-like protein 4 isoform X5 [Magnolia sinica]
MNEIKRVCYRNTCAKYSLVANSFAIFSSKFLFFPLSLHLVVLNSGFINVYDYILQEMADAVVSVLLDKLVSLLVSEGHQQLEFNDQFEETKKELQYMQKYLKEADRVRRKDRNEILKMVMSDLRELVYDAEDVIADCQILFQKKCQGRALNFTSYCSPTHLKTRHQLGKRLSKINKKIREVKDRMKSFLDATPRQTGKYEDGGNMPLTHPILMDEDEMVGLEDESVKIRNWILEANGPLTMIGIVGLGGIGKTTLAQKIYNSESAENSFKHSFFITVSQNFKFDELLKKILKKLKVEEKSLRGDDVRELLERLKSILDEKYLIVLDDVWGTDEGRWWDSLKSALPSVEGSCVIVTSRNEKVAQSMGATDKCIHRLQVLSDEDSWSLFSKVAFARNGGKCTNPDLEVLGKEIVKGCGGLPLAINVVGGMMLGKGDSIHEWKQISKHLKEELQISQKDETIISTLELSYEELPIHLKPCFLCLAMLPEDYELPVVYIVELWIGEGFVWGRNEKTAFEIGEECFAELFNRSLILGTDKDVFESRFIRCKMHDMVRDMVIKIAREESFFVSLESGGRIGFSVQSRHLGISENTTVESIRNSSTKLRTLVGMEMERNEIIASVKVVLCKVRWLRVLDLSLSNTKIDVVAKNWLSGIGSLQHLVFLRIENSALRRLPASIRNLHNLQILCLRDCPNLEMLPVSITTLEKLTDIVIFDCPSLECMPEGLGKLSNLERLFGFTPMNLGGKNGSDISDLKKLTRLRKLSMDIKSEKQIEGEWNVLSMLYHLQFLELDFEGSSIESEGVVKKIDSQFSAPLKSLRELHLWDYTGESTPAWLSPISLPNLQFLFIGGGRIKKMGPRFWDSENGVWKVEVLVLKYLKEMEEEWTRMRRAMPSLRLVKVQNCPKLRSFPLNDTFEDYRGNWSIWRKEEEKGGMLLRAHSAPIVFEAALAALEEGGFRISRAHSALIFYEVPSTTEEEKEATGAVEDEEEKEEDKFYSFPREEGTSIQEISSE